MAIRFGSNNNGSNANGFIENQEAAPQNAAFWVDGNGHVDVLIADSGVQVNTDVDDNTIITPQLIVMNGTGVDSMTLRPGGLQMNDNGTSFSIQVGTSETDIISDKEVVFQNTNVQRDTAATLPNDLVRLAELLSGFIQNLNPFTDPPQTAGFNLTGTGSATNFIVTTGGVFANTDTVFSGSLDRNNLLFTSTSATGSSSIARQSFSITADGGVQFSIAAFSPTELRFSSAGVFNFSTTVRSAVVPVAANDLVRLTDLIATKTFTVGSVAFGIAGGGLGQDNANLFWDDTNNRLGIGTAVPKSKIDASNASFGAYAGVTSAPANSVIVGGILGVNFPAPTQAFQVARTALSASVENVIAVFADNATITGQVIISATTTGAVVTSMGIRSANSQPLMIGTSAAFNAINIANIGTVTIATLLVTTVPSVTNAVLRFQDQPAGSVSQALVAATTVVVTIGITMANTTYKVAYTATNAAAAVNLFVTAKTTTQFTVTYLAPITATVTFDWMISI